MKCIHCKKLRDYHHARTFACPIGKRHRTLGYLGFSDTQFFTVKDGKKGVE